MNWKAVIDEKRKEDKHALAKMAADAERMASWAEVNENFHTYKQELQEDRDGAKDCTVLSAYVDDVKMDGENSRRRVLWKCIRLMFLGADEKDVANYLGVKSATPTRSTRTRRSTSSRWWRTTSRCTSGKRWK